jgi:hypothetical protein
MSSRKLNDYFNRKYTLWNITGFLDESQLEPWEKKIEDYVINLEQIVKYDKDGRRNKAQKLLDKYRNVSSLLFVLDGRISVISEIAVSVVMQGHRRPPRFSAVSSELILHQPHRGEEYSLRDSIVQGSELTRWT